MSWKQRWAGVQSIPQKQENKIKRGIGLFKKKTINCCTSSSRLFILGYLTTLFQLLRLYTEKWLQKTTDKQARIWRRACPIYRLYPRSRLKRLIKTTKRLSGRRQPDQIQTGTPYSSVKNNGRDLKMRISETGWNRDWEKRILKKHSLRMWTKLIWLRKKSSGNLLRTR